MEVNTSILAKKKLEQAKIIWKIIHGRAEIWDSLRVFNLISHEWSLCSIVRYPVEHQKRNFISASNYGLFCYVNILLTRRANLIHVLKKRTRCHSFVAQNRASDVTTADWLSQTHVKSYCNFSRMVVRFFSVVEIPIRHSSLHDKYIYQLPESTYFVVNW